MPVSREVFKNRWPAAVRRSRQGSVRRSIDYVLGKNDGTAVTVAATVTAVGGALVATGLVEYSLVNVPEHKHRPAPMGNLWFSVGLALVVLGALIAIAIFVTLVVRRIGDERWRAHLTQHARQGQLFLDQDARGTPASDDAAKSRWYEETRDDLLNHDRTGALATRFETTDAGTMPEGPLGPIWLRSHVRRLVEFLQEVRD